MDRLAALNFDKSKPGFYDDPVFMKAEESDPTILDDYAEYVIGLNHTPEYLARARTVVEAVSRFTFEEFSKDPTIGACIDISMALSRFLEQDGIWNFVVRGNLLIEFEPAAKLRQYRMETRGRAPGHAWVFAPPFGVVDLTIEHQRYENGEGAHLSGPIVSEGERARYTVEDLFPEEWHEEMLVDLGHKATLDTVREHNPALIDRIELLGVRSVKLPKAVVKYVPHSVTACAERLDVMDNPRLSGRGPQDLWALYQTTKKS